jgi:cell division protein ZapA (FtsZ GTPase activity inhibitor)
MQNSISINIVVGDRNYRVRIDAQGEESVRKISKQINDKIIEFKTDFAGKDMQDYISMVLLWFVTEQQQGSFAISAISKELEGLEQLLEKA